MFAKRRIRPELLDHAAPETARRNLADLVRINQRFGGHSVLREVLARVAKQSDEFTLLDVGAASGDSARLVREVYASASVTSLDNNATNLAAAPDPKAIADAFALPFGADSFDFVLASLFLHHFSDERVTELLGSLYRVARKALLICDLERRVLPYCFLPATKPFLGWNRITVHDGMVSVRAGFQAGELLALVRDAGIRNAEVETHRPAFRISVVARK